MPVFVEVMADRVACVAFPAEAAAEMCDERGSTIDDPGNDTMPVPLDEDLSKAVDREKDLLDAMTLPGTPVDEAERRRSWIAPPLKVRIAIRGMHRQFGHPSSTVLVHADIFDVMPVNTTSPNISLPKWRFRKTTFSVGISASMFWKSKMLLTNLTCVRTFSTWVLLFNKSYSCDKDTVRRPVENVWTALSVCGSDGLVGQKP